ncbi:MAG: hypothetical protein ABJB05_07390, partial [Parafilimonas sp.]
MKTVFTLFNIFFVLNVHAQTLNKAGTLDSNFGENGFISSSYPSLINSIIQQQDGKILAAGNFLNLNGLIVRFLPDGTLDSTFGTNGAAISNPPGGANEMLLTADEKILVVGSFVDVHGSNQSFLARFTQDGHADSSFGVNGSSMIPKFHRYDGFTDIALTSTGDVIVGGLGYNNPNTLDSQYSIISRISSNGAFDYGFGNNGYVINLVAIGLNDLAVQTDDKIVAAGYNFAGGFQQQDFVFSRYNSDGTIDKSFGKNGNVIIDGNGGEDVPEKIIIQSDNKLVFGGYSSADKYYMSALRLNTDGSLDKTFGKEGKVFIDFGDSASKAYDMVRQPDGKFILAGGAYKFKGTDLQGGSFGSSRINIDGSIDSSFGINGTQITNYISDGEAYCVGLQSDGKILLGGYYQNTNGYQSYLMLRYNNSTNKREVLITKIRHWIQHHNGITWDGNSSISSYVVQRSYDGIHFSSIARINANNNSAFTYNDASPLSGNNYYRLQTTSINGAVNYSNVIAVSADEDAIKISPNPAKNYLHIDGLSSNTKLTVLDVSGNVKLRAVANNSSYNLNIASLTT